MIPGEYQTRDGEIELYAGRRPLALSVADTGGRRTQASTGGVCTSGRVSSMVSAREFSRRCSSPSRAA